MTKQAIADKRLLAAHRATFRDAFGGSIATARERFMRMAKTLAKKADAATLNSQAYTMACILDYGADGNDRHDQIRREIDADQRKRSAAFGRRGARIRMSKMTPEERSRVAKKAAAARWKKAA